MSHKDRKAREKKELRESIINAAREIAKKDGWNNVTIRKIADAIEYTPPIVYEYFDNKEALFAELVYLGFKKLINEYQSECNISIDKHEHLRNLATAQWYFAYENYDLYQLMFSIERIKPNEKMIEKFNILRKIFLDISNNDRSLAVELMIYWMTLIHGSISLLMFVPPPSGFESPSPFELFQKNVERFLKNI